MAESTPVRGGAQPALSPEFQSQTLGITFFDLSRMAEWANADEDLRVASFLQQFYELAATHLEPAGGRILKFMGDAGLAVFATDRVEEGIFALCALAQEVRQAARGFGFDTHLNVNVHVGSVVAGPFGPPSVQRFDIIGKAVNITARLGRRGITLSPQAFRCLSAEGRTRFEKIAAPVTYRLRP